MRTIVLALAVASSAAAQTAPAEPPVESPPKKTIVVPVPRPRTPEEEEAEKKKAQKHKPIVVPLPKEEAPPHSTDEAATSVEQPAPPPGQPTEPVAEPDAPPADAAAQPPPELTPKPAPEAPPAPPLDSGAYIDGHLREGAFLSGPGSLTFVLHHTIMLGVGGLATQITSLRPFSFDRNSREAMLAGLLIGGGLGFGASAWWQFHHWIDHPMANFGIVNSVISGMFFTGLVDLMTNDPTALTWVALIGSELGAWLTATVGGGEMTLAKGLFIASGGFWGLAYATLLLAIVGLGSPETNWGAAIDTLLIAPGIGAGAMALAGLQYSPTASQVLRADIFGAGVGAGVFLLSALLLGFQTATPYVLALLSSAGAIATVSLLWEEAAERPALHRDLEKGRPYRTVWW